ncbi:MAG: hypothetical protein MUF05_03290 [Candidatus Omnitrophica bacterium]|jgi:hypothetical protein|nr:hypothetical protein [Candidatus Omnitrophota bacterium]
MVEAIKKFFVLYLIAFFLSFPHCYALIISSPIVVSPSTILSIPPNTDRNISYNYTAPTGTYASIQEAGLFIGSSSTIRNNSVYVYYHQSTNKLYLRNDSDTQWLGGFTPGSNNIIENSQVRLNCALTRVIKASSTLSVSWCLNFKLSFSGKRYLAMISKKLTSSPTVSWAPCPNIQINSQPLTGLIAAASGMNKINVPVTYLTIYSDPDGWQNLNNACLLILDATTNAYIGYFYYNQNTNRIYLRNDTNSAWLGGVIPGAEAIIQNSFVSLNCAKTTVTGSGTSIFIRWQITYKDQAVGNKKLYVSSTDDLSASSALLQRGWWKVTDSGETIGQAGGEVTSSDGKIKLIIPSGALTYSAFISLENQKTTLSGSAPEGTGLLSAAECLPYGLVFSKPVQLIYTLPKAEVPGTETELGLYDANQLKIIPTGQISQVNADGYTVKFLLQHFSTYAALKSLAPQNTPIGSAVRIPLPDLFTGAFGHAIPITVPSGRKGIQPALGLSYRSSNPNSWTGVGFSLNPGYITRSTRLGPPSYIDTQDTFYFITDAGTTELVHLIDNLYQAKIESGFNKFFKESDDSWRILGKDGSVIYLGQSSESKEGSSKGTFSWYITKAMDINGNYLTYSYTKDQGKSYLSLINYTGHTSGISPTNTVEFTLEDRTDIPSSYISSAKIATAKRLKEILVKIKGDLVWRYELEYAYSPDTNRSLLKSIKQVAADGKALPEQKFGYQAGK